MEKKGGDLSCPYRGFCMSSASEIGVDVRLWSDNIPVCSMEDKVMGGRLPYIMSQGSLIPYLGVYLAFLQQIDASNSSEKGKSC